MTPGKISQPIAETDALRGNPTRSGSKKSARKPEQKAMSEHSCPACGKPVPSERYELLGVKTCLDCTPTAIPYLGYVSYEHKTGGQLLKTTDPRMFALWRKPANRRR